MAHDHSSLGIESEGHLSRSEINAKMCATWVSTAASYEHWLIAVVVDFHCDITSCELAWRGMLWHSWGQQQWWSQPSTLGMATQLVWPWYSIEGSFPVQSSYWTLFLASGGLTDWLIDDIDELLLMMLLGRSWSPRTPRSSRPTRRQRKTRRRSTTWSKRLSRWSRDERRPRNDGFSWAQRTSCE